MKSLTKYMAIVVGVVSMAACGKDFLNRSPYGVETEENFYQSPGAAFKSLVKCYQTFNDFYGYEAPRQELGNMATDDSEKGGSDAGDRTFVTDLGYGRTLSDNPTLQNFWAQCYKGIGNCNVALENLPINTLIDENGYPLSEAVVARYLAELKFLRAFFYFDLARVFGGVPLLDRTLTVDEKEALTRATLQETFAFIAADLVDAADAASLPLKSELAGSELGRVSKEAVWAMQARVYLYFAKDDPSLFSLAAASAKKVIDVGSFSLDPEFQNLFLPNSYRSPEAVFSVIKGDDPGLNIYGSFVPLFSSPRGPSGAWGFDQPTQNLVDEFEPGDPRLLFTVLEPGDVFPREVGQEVLDFSSYPSTGYHNRKTYLPQSRRGPGWGDDAWTFHAIRYADVLLMYAEALIESGEGSATAATYINLVRSRAAGSSRVDTEAISRVRTIADMPLEPVGESDDLREAVRHERRVEFAMEFQRLYDLQRWNGYVERMNNYALLPGSNGKGAAFRKGVHELFPVPQVEIDRSGGVITQNPGY